MTDREKCTVYLLTNTANGKIYIGQTWESPVENRMGKEGGQYANSPYIFAAIQKHGVCNFKYTILGECSSQEEADKLEIENIIQYNSRDPKIGYNLKEGGSHGKHAEETKLKISQSQIKLFQELSPAERARRAAPISEYWRGKERGPHTSEWKENNSKFMIERHKKDGHPMKGKHHTQEAKQRMAEASLGRKDTPETTQNRKAAQKHRMIDPEKEALIIKLYQEGVKISEITEITGHRHIYRILDRNNIPIDRPHDNWTGRQHSEETKNKMSKSRKSYLNGK